MRKPPLVFALVTVTGSLALGVNASLGQTTESSLPSTPTASKAQDGTADLEVSWANPRTSPVPQTHGAGLVYRFKVTNNGPDTAEDVRVDVDGAGQNQFDAQFLKSVPSNCTFVNGGNSDAGASGGCSLGPIAAGASGTMRFKSAGVPRRAAWKAFASTTTFDPNEGNDRAKAVLTVIPQATTRITGSHYINRTRAIVLRALSGHARASRAANISPGLLKITKVEVAVAKVRGHHCKWLRNKTKFRSGSCQKGFWLKAKGTRKWRFKAKARLARKRWCYFIFSRATNKGGAVEDAFRFGRNELEECP